ncbi:MAG: hypothetical protein SGPRY_008726, partial [Prymnesium sp.]
MSEAHLLQPGLHSPGPMYVVPGSFTRAAERSKHPTWGRHQRLSLKMARYRSEEVRFLGKRHMREMQGHFSPGPQYALPTTIGGSEANFTASLALLASRTSTSKLSATELGGSPHFKMTRGSFTDVKRLHDFDPASTGTAFWRSATMLMPKEPNIRNSAP